MSTGPGDISVQSSYPMRQRSLSVAKPNLLYTLPHEVLRLIIDNVGEDNDLLSLCLTSKLLNSIASSFFYEAITVGCREGFNPRHPDLKQFCRDQAGIDFNPNLRYVQELTVNTEFREYVEPKSRCWHNRTLLADAEEDDEVFGTKAKSPGSTEVSRETQDQWDANPKFYQDHFYNFCMAFKDDHLKSFSWHLGACVPENILGPDGYLPQHQRDLEEIYLMTDGSCQHSDEQTALYDFTKFRRLQEFSWMGVNSNGEFTALKECLSTHRDRLKTVEVDFVNWAFANRAWQKGQPQESNTCRNFFAEAILGLSLDVEDESHSTRFSSLKYLILGQISFDQVTTQLAQAFSFSQLKKLTLWRCIGVTSLFRHLAQEKTKYSLEFLELTNGFDEGEGGDDGKQLAIALSKFLMVLPGLQELLLCLPLLGYGWRDLNPAIFKHLPTLKRLIIHSRTWNVDPGSAFFEQEEDGEYGYDQEIATIFTQGNCEFLGLQCRPYQVRAQLDKVAKDSSCKVLHLRAARDWLDRTDQDDRVEVADVVALANWIFGPDGFPNLQILGYGDYLFPCLGDEEDDENVIYTRRDPNDPNEPEENQEAADSDEWSDVDEDEDENEDEDESEDQEVGGLSESAEDKNDDNDSPVYFRNLRASDDELYKLLQQHMDAMGACRYKALVSVDPKDFDRQRLLLAELA